MTNISKKHRCILTKEAKRREDWISLSDEEKLSSPDTGEIRQAVVGEQGIRTLKKIKKASLDFHYYIKESIIFLILRMHGVIQEMRYLQ